MGGGRRRFITPERSLKLRRLGHWAERLLLRLLFIFWAQPPATVVKRVVLVELTRLGDLVAASALIDPLRLAFPGASLSVVGDQAYAGIFANDARVDYLGLPKGGRAFIAQAHKLAATLGGANTVWVVASPSSRNSLLTYFAKPGLAAGYLLPGGGLGYDEASPLQRCSREQGWVSCGSSDASDHLVRRAGKALECLLPAPHDLTPRILAQGGRVKDKIVLHAGAQWAWRRWPLERFVALGQSLLAKGYRVTLISAEAGAPVNATGLELASPVDLRALRELLASASLLIANDSGPLHLAAACGTPCLGLYGPNLPSRSGPWPLPGAGSPHRVLRESVPCSPCAQDVCVQADDWCMAKIEFTHVLEEAHTLMEGRS